MKKTAKTRTNGQTSRLRWQTEATLSRAWLKENLPEVAAQIAKRAARKHPRPRRGTGA